MRHVALAALIAFGAVPPALAQSDADRARIRDAIWAKEQKIYADRANGRLDFYIANTSPHYVGWPPSAPKPLALTGLKEDGKRLAGQTREKLSMELTDFTLSGDTAVIYYLNHRTMKPDGTPVDEKFENIHVWTREGGDWKLIGAMSRLQPRR